MSTNKALELAAQLEKEGHDKPSDWEVADELRRLASVEAELAAIKALEPVAWISTDCIGERYFVFSPPLDDDPLTPLVVLPQPKEWP